MLNDIALIKLDRMVTLNDGVQVACLPLGKYMAQFAGQDGHLE